MKTRILTCILTAIVLLSLVVPSASANALAIERQIFTFVTEEMGLNSAAACGILANIEAESSFNLTTIGDKGTSFGLCQWHNSRYEDLKTFCLLRGYDYRTLEGQMNFMAYELKTAYQVVYNTMLNVPDTADGAYTAAYYWCYYYERPADLEGASLRRGRNAQFKYWLRYGGTASGNFDSNGYSGAIYDGYGDHAFYWDDAPEQEDTLTPPAEQSPLYIPQETLPDLIPEQVPEQFPGQNQNAKPEQGQPGLDRYQYVPHHLPPLPVYTQPGYLGPMGCLFLTGAPVKKRKWQPDGLGVTLPEDWDGSVALTGEDEEDPDTAPEAQEDIPEVACGA